MNLYRTQGLLDTKTAKEKTIVIIGLGSLGSGVAELLAYEWGHLVFIDPEELKIENIERHVLGRSYLRQNKAEAMRNFLIDEKGLPSRSIVAYTESDKVLPKWPNADLIICCVDDQTICRQINAWCVQKNIPAVYGGVYPMGTGGEVILLPNPKEVCYLCAEDARAERTLKPAYVGNYGVDPALINADTDHPKAVPALKKSVVAIAADMANLAWQFLFPEEAKPGSQILFHALDEWRQVAQIRTGSNDLKAVAGMIGARKGLDLAEDLIRLGPPDKDGWYSLEIRRNYWPKNLIRWTRCPMHGQGVQISEL